MNVISATKARENIYQLMAEINNSSSPVMVTNTKGKDVVMVGIDDWNALNETLYLCSIPGMAESIIEGGKTPIEDCVPESEVEW